MDYKQKNKIFEKCKKEYFEPSKKFHSKNADLE